MAHGLSYFRYYTYPHGSEYEASLDYRACAGKGLDVDPSKATIRFGEAFIELPPAVLDELATAWLELRKAAMAPSTRTYNEG